jgi:hypothetical protein
MRSEIFVNPLFGGHIKLAVRVIKSDDITLVHGIEFKVSQRYLIKSQGVFF